MMATSVEKIIYPSIVLLPGRLNLSYNYLRLAKARVFVSPPARKIRPLT